MKCPIETRDHAGLVAYGSGSLDAATTILVEQHIGECGRCREFVNAQRAVWERLDAWEGPPVSADFDQRLYRRIQQEVSWWDLAVRPFRGLFARQGLPLTAAAAVLIMAGVLLERPVAPPVAPSVSAQVDSVSADQMVDALDEMELLREFNGLVRSENADPRL